MVRIEARIGLLRILEAADKQSRAGQQHQRQRNLRDHQPAMRRDLCSPPEVLSASSFRTVTGESAEARSAGTTPETTAVKIETRMVASRTLCRPRFR